MGNIFDSTMVWALEVRGLRLGNGYWRELRSLNLCGLLGFF